jgi:dienelactone hydrolase
MILMIASIIITIFSFWSQWEWDFRWYGPAILIVILAFLGLWAILKPRKKKEQVNPKIIVLKGILILLLVFLAMIPAIVFPRYERISPTGSYPIETAKFTLVDQSRDELFTIGQDYRKVNVSIWYPQNPQNDETFPLIIFSHGGLGTITSNESLYLELASHGYVVYSIGHPYHALWTEDENGSVTWVDMDYFLELQEEDPKKDKVQSYNYYQKWMKVRTDDINFVLDTILDNSDTRIEEINASIDVDSIGLIGHSIGGSAVLAMPRLRDDIDAVIALESPFLFDIVGVQDDEFIWLEDEYRVPVLNIYSDSSWENLTNWSQYAQNVAMLAESSDDISNLYLPGAGHFSLTDLSLASPFFTRILEGGDPSVEYRTYLRAVNDAVLEFFNQYLKQDLN